MPDARVGVVRRRYIQGRWLRPLHGRAARRMKAHNIRADNARRLHHALVGFSVLNNDLNLRALQLGADRRDDRASVDVAFEPFGILDLKGENWSLLLGIEDRGITDSWRRAVRYQTRRMHLATGVHWNERAVKN